MIDQDDGVDAVGDLRVAFSELTRRLALKWREDKLSRGITVENPNDQRVTYRAHPVEEDDLAVVASGVALREASAS